VLHDAEEIRLALAQAGWSVTRLVENALTLGRRECDVTNVFAMREKLRAFAVVARDCAEGDDVDRSASPAPSPTRAARRVGRTKVYVDVQDYGRAAQELEAILAVPRTDTRAWVDTFLARGWQVTRQSSVEIFNWDGSWHLLAERPGEALSAGVIVSWPGRDEGIRESTVSRGSATAKIGSHTVHVAVTSAAEANALADALLSRGASSAGDTR
jgi:hypothetical protein